MTFGIIGLGVVGSCYRRWLDTQGEIFVYDIKGEGSMEEVNKADMVFVCVNTPFDLKTGRLNTAFVESSVLGLSGSKIVVICSTVPRGTCANLTKDFPQHVILHNPEFLRAKTSWDDFTHPLRQVIGIVRSSDSKIAEDLMLMLPRCDHSYIVPTGVSELVKLSSNLLLAVRIAAAQKVMLLAGLDGEQVENILAVDSRIGAYGFDCSEQIGYSGRCLPKDVRAFLCECEDAGVGSDWLIEMDKENDKLLVFQGKKSDYGWPETLKENEIE
jgi:UDP-glucose 6-dehydrogenase